MGGDGEVAVVHNGVIENFKSLKQSPCNEGYEFRSATDTEVIAHLIASCLKRQPPVADMAAAEYRPLWPPSSAPWRSSREPTAWR